MNKDKTPLDTYRERRFNATVGNDPCYYQGDWDMPCVARVVDPAEHLVGSRVSITGTPYRIIAVIQRGVDEFGDGALWYCYGVQDGEARPRATGKYLRKKRHGPQDPTMTHVDDPYAFQVGDYMRDGGGWDRIVAIEDEVFPDTRFARLRPCENPPADARVWDIISFPQFGF